MAGVEQAERLLEALVLLPIRCSAGTRTFSRMTSAVSLERSPSFSILRPLESPAMPFSTTKVEMPRCPCSGAVEAITT